MSPQKFSAATTLTTPGRAAVPDELAARRPTRGRRRDDRDTRAGASHNENGSRSQSQVDPGSARPGPAMMAAMDPATAPTGLVLARGPGRGRRRALVGFVLATEKNHRTAGLGRCSFLAAAVAGVYAARRLPANRTLAVIGGVVAVTSAWLAPPTRRRRGGAILVFLLRGRGRSRRRAPDSPSRARRARPRASGSPRRRARRRGRTDDRRAAERPALGRGAPRRRGHRRDLARPLPHPHDEPRARDRVRHRARRDHVDLHRLRRRGDARRDLVRRRRGARADEHAARSRSRSTTGPTSARPRRSWRSSTRTA